MKRKEMNVEIKAIGESGEFEAYLNNFDFVDHALDNTQKGAFVNSINRIKSRGYQLPMLYMHDHEKLIGHWTNLEEDNLGLKATGKIDLDTDLGAEKWRQVKSGSLSGVSIGYKVVDEAWDSHNKQNLLKEIDLMEASLVSVPCNDISRVTAIKTMIDHDADITKTDLERLLKDAGLSNKESRYIVAKYDNEPEVKEVQVENEYTAEDAFNKYKAELKELFEAEAQSEKDAAEAEQKQIQELRSKYSRYLNK